MRIRFFRQSGHKFFEFSFDGEVFSRSVCVDGWLNKFCAPSFCIANLSDGWLARGDDGYLEIDDCDSCYCVSCPTCFGYVSRRGNYRTVGNYHVDFYLDKAGLHQFLNNYLY